MEFAEGISDGKLTISEEESDKIIITIVDKIETPKQTHIQKQIEKPEAMDECEIPQKIAETRTQQRGNKSETTPESKPPQKLP